MDKSLAKKYSKIAVTLGVIAGGSALLIGLANVITEGPIKQHEIEKKLESIKVVYGENAKYGDEVVISKEHKEAYPSLISYYNAKDANDKEIGNVFVTEGRNQFGAIKMAIGVGVDYQFDKISLIVNEQTLPNEVNAFVDKVNNGGSIDDVKCGATYGATLINEMGKEALSYYKNVMKAGAGVETRDFLANIFGENSKYGEEVKAENTSYPEIKGYYTATSKDDVLLGYVIIAEGSHNVGGEHKIKLSVGITPDGKHSKIFLMENGDTPGYAEKLEGYVDGVNGGKDIDDVTCGATEGAKYVNKLVKQAINFYKSDIKKSIVDFSPFCKQVFTDEGATFVRHNLVSDKAYPNIKDYWTALSKTGTFLGRVYHVNFDEHDYMVGVNAVNEDSHTLKAVYMVSAGDSDEEKAALQLIEKINAGEDVTKIVEGDAGFILEIKTSVKQSLEHAKAYNVAAPINMDDQLKYTFDDVNGGAIYCEHVDYDNVSYPEIIEYWNVKNKSGLYEGRVYHISIPGATGNSDALVAIKPGTVMGGSLHNIVVSDSSKLTGTEDYVKQLKEKPDTVINEIDSDRDKLKGTGHVEERNYVRNIVKPSLMHYGENIIPEFYLDNIFVSDKKVTYNEPLRYVNNTVVSKDGNVREYWNVLDAKQNYIGRIYHTAFKGRHATINALIGFNTVVTPVPNSMPKVENKLVKMFLVNKADSEYGAKLQAYVDNLNAGNLSMQDDVHNGATASTEGGRTMVNEAFAHYVANPILPLYKGTENLDILFDKKYNIGEHRLVEDNNYPNVVEYWKVSNDEGKPIAYAYHCALPGKHGTMEITVSVTIKEVTQYGRTSYVADKIDKIHLFATAPDEYGEILQNYVNDLNTGKQDINVDVQNGATSSTNGVRTMALQALEHASKNQLDAELAKFNETLTTYAKAQFGDSSTFTPKGVDVNDIAYGNIVKYWDVTGGDLDGRIYHGILPGEHGVLHVLVALDSEGTFKNVFWVNGIDISHMEKPTDKFSPLYYTYAAAEYIAEINKNKNIYDDVNNGATGTTGGLLSLVHQAIDHFNETKIGG